MRASRQRAPRHAPPPSRTGGFFITGLADSVLGSGWREEARRAEATAAASAWWAPPLLDPRMVAHISDAFARTDTLPHVALERVLLPARADALSRALRRARFGPHHHEAYRIDVAPRAGQQRSALTDFVDWLASPLAARAHLELVGMGDLEPAFIQVQTARATAGHHFPLHVDTDAEGLAVIYNFTRGFTPRHGGELVYPEAGLRIPPEFNSAFFCRPRGAPHEVTELTAAASGRYRYTVTAFYLADER